MFGALIEYFAGLTIGFLVGRNVRNTAQIARQAPPEPRSTAAAIGWLVAFVVLAAIIASGGH
jgi:hypothetical protein